jgi:hypothetical protein
MKRPILRAGLIVGALGVFMPGCQQAAHNEAASKAKPDDPTAWSDKDLVKADANGPGPSSSLPKSSRGTGTWSSEAQSVERSLGIGQ